MTEGTCTRSGRLGIVVVVAFLVAACGGSTHKTVAVTASDYSFTGIPATVKAGTVFTLTNSSTKEIHEMVALRLPDTERRPVDELARLPEDQVGELSPGPPALVLVAPPGGAPQVAILGGGSLKEKGRYVVLCFIPTGAEPAAYMAAAKAAQAADSPPERVPGGPAHFTHGMYAQIVVT